MDLVVIDTNVLFTKNDVELINNETFAKIQQARTYATFQLCIPRICLAEILFQKCTFGGQQLTQASKALSIIARLTDAKPASIDSYPSFSRTVAKRLLKWCKQNKLRILKIPLETIRWKRLIENAIWHHPPFSPPSSQKEKGFKDALVLETALYCWDDNKRAAVTFITDDKLLGEAARQRLGKASGFEIFASVDDWLSHLRLSHEKKTKAWTDKVLAAAPKVFFEPADPNCVYVRFDIPTKIRDLFKLQLEDSIFLHPMDALVQTPSLPFPTTPAVNFSNLLQPRWVALSEDKIWIRPANFVSKDKGANCYHWRSDVVFAKLYERFSDSTSFLPSPSYVRTAIFSVYWKSQVSANGDFTACELEQIKHASSKAELANDGLAREYGLPTQYEVLLNRMSSKTNAPPSDSTTSPFGLGG